VWKLLRAGLASIYRFLNETITDDMGISIIQSDNFSEMKYKEYIDKLRNIKRKALFYSDYLYDEDVPKTEKYIDCNNLKLYFLERLLLDLDYNDIMNIGRGVLLLDNVTVTISKEQIKERAKSKTGEEKERIKTKNNIYFDINYKANFVSTENIRYFFSEH
jgi:hypothetical protein